MHILKRFTYGLLVAMLPVISGCAIRESLPGNTLETAPFTSDTQQIETPVTPGIGAGWNVLLITLDAVRFDHLGCAGYYRNTSPQIDRLAQNGVLFTNCYSQSAHTHPAIASLMTGKYPCTHRSVVGSRVLSNEFVTLAERLQASDYRTAAFVQNYWLSPEFGFSQGFETYHYLHTALSDDQNEADIQTWLNSSDAQPFFLWLHYLEPHAPYLPRMNFLPHFLADYSGEYYVFTNDMLIDHRINQIPLASEDLRYIQACYDSEIRQVDEAIGRVLNLIRQASSPTNRPVLVIVIADHGEEFYDHQSLGHDHTLYNELIHVPAIMALPDIMPIEAKVDGLIQTIDIVPTLLDILGVPALEDAEGESVRELLNGNKETPRRPAIAQRYFWNQSSHLVSIVQFPWKMIVEIPNVDPADMHYWRPYPESCGVQLFNLDNDPREQLDVRDAYPEVMADLFDELLLWYDSHHEQSDPVAHDEEAPLDQETLSKLKALGYLLTN